MTGGRAVQPNLAYADVPLGHSAPHGFDDVPRFHLQRGETPAAVDGDGLSQDGVQALHLLPVQHAVSAALPLLPLLVHVFRRVNEEFNEAHQTDS